MSNEELQELIENYTWALQHPVLFGEGSKGLRQAQNIAALASAVRQFVSTLTAKHEAELAENEKDISLLYDNCAKLEAQLAAKDAEIVNLTSEISAKSAIINQAQQTVDSVYASYNDCASQLHDALEGLAQAREQGRREALRWVPYPMPQEVALTTRMHLTREDVAVLIPILQRFVGIGDLKP